MVANLLCSQGTCELPCELPQTGLLFKMQLIGKDMKHCHDLQDLKIFGWARRGENYFLY